MIINVYTLQQISQILPLNNVKRWSRELKKRNDVPQPKLIHLYNQQIGGVDLFDQFLAKYRPTIKSKRWYWPIVINCFGIIRVAA